MLWLFKSCALTITLIALAACGTRGPLYLAPQQLPPPIKAPPVAAQKAPSAPATTPQTHPNTTKDQD